MGCHLGINSCSRIDGFIFEFLLLYDRVIDFRTISVWVRVVQVVLSSEFACGLRSICHKIDLHLIIIIDIDANKLKI